MPKTLVLYDISEVQFIRMECPMEKCHATLELPVGGRLPQACDQCDTEFHPIAKVSPKLAELAKLNTAMANARESSITLVFQAEV